MFYFIIKLDVFNKPKKSFIFFFNNRYLANIFYSIIPDTRVVKVFTVKEL
jgi:hypothetical protein